MEKQIDTKRKSLSNISYNLHRLCEILEQILDDKNECSDCHCRD